MLSCLLLRLFTRSSQRRKFSPLPRSSCLKITFPAILCNSLHEVSALAVSNRIRIQLGGDQPLRSCGEAWDSSKALVVPLPPLLNNLDRQKTPSRHPQLPLLLRRIGPR